MSTTSRTARAAAPVLLAALALGACSGGGGQDAAATAPTTPATSSSATAPVPATSTATSPTTASAPPVDAVPAGAGTAPTVDLDGDGVPDTLWLADVDGERRLGVDASADGVSSVASTSAAPQRASASAAVLASGAPVVLLDTGRSVALYVYRQEDAGLVPVPDATGGQYTFSLGFTPYGTGLACEARADGLHLYGEDATSDDGTTWTVTRTEVVVDADRVHARNGDAETVAAGVPADDPRVAAAHGTTCGDATAVAVEPA
ncbi:hypothetical protein [Kineococcus sp. SYSU DK004]|uniref:hypothetical protein n=1 Tax=Kineococcus sp. SYSU DK004 TaxID=3383125 RepID=UPI003D7E616A